MVDIFLLFILELTIFMVERIVVHNRSYLSVECPLRIEVRSIWEKQSTYSMLESVHEFPFKQVLFQLRVIRVFFFVFIRGELVIIAGRSILSRGVKNVIA